MSLVRFGPASGVYIFREGVPGHLTCYACTLLPLPEGGFRGDACVADADLLEHLAQHERAGDKVALARRRWLAHLRGDLTVGV